MRLSTISVRPLVVDTATNRIKNKLNGFRHLRTGIHVTCLVWYSKIGISSYCELPASQCKIVRNQGVILDSKTAQQAYAQAVIKEARAKIADGVELVLAGMEMPDILREIDRRAQMRLRLAASRKEAVLKLVK